MDSDRPPDPPEEPYTRDIQEGETPSSAVVRTIAALWDIPSNELHPLAEAVDPDALNKLVVRGDDVAVEFDYVGVTVTVDRQSVTVRPATEN